MTDNDDPWALVIGASRGLGAACAQQLARERDAVVMTYRDGQDAAALIEDQCRAAGAPWTRSVRLEMDDPHGCQSVITELIERHGAPTSVVISAAQLLRASLDDTTIDDFASVLTTNCVSPFAIARVCGLAMREAGAGSITLLSSMVGLFGVRDRVAYATSKAGMVGLTKALAVDLAPHVRVNAVLLGTFATDMNAALQADDAALGTLTSRVPLGRLGHADEVSSVVATLAHRASFVTGAVWEVDGGTTARLATPSGDPILD